MSLSIASVFDANFYRAANTDLVKAGLTTDSQLLNHFQNYGLNEGRSFSPLIDLSFYRASNSDLAGYNNSQLLNHLQNNGVAEGRSFSPIVDLKYYRQLNSDLASFNYEQLFNHLNNNGVSEGRSFSVFSLGFYKSYNSDLASFNNSQLLNHFEINGIKEGRQFSPFFDFNYYRANNKDLANLNNSQLLQHFEIYGINEGRQSSPFFDAGYYKANNPDLLGLKGIKLLEHFDFYGIKEGRLAARDYAGNTLNNARLLAVDSKNPSIVFEHLGTDDPVDYYRFDSNLYRTVQINIASYSKSVLEEVLDSNGGVRSSYKTANTNNKDSSIYSAPQTTIRLRPGTYYIRIQPQAGNTDYQLQFYSFISSADALDNLNLISTIAGTVLPAINRPVP